MAYIQLRINNSTDKLRNKLESLKNQLEAEIQKIDDFKGHELDYTPNELGIIQCQGYEIDNLCGRIGTLHELKEFEQKK